MVQKWQLESSNPETKVVSDMRLAQKPGKTPSEGKSLSAWSQGKPENPRKMLKPTGGSRTQNWQNIGGISDGKWVWPKTQQFHTLIDECPVGREKNYLHRGLTVEQLNRMI